MGIEDFMEVEIHRGSKEFAEVERQFMETLAGSCDIVKVGTAVSNRDLGVLEVRYRYP